MSVIGCPGVPCLNVRCEVILSTLDTMFVNYLNNVEKSDALPYSQIPGPPSYPLIGNVLGYQCPETGRST